MSLLETLFRAGLGTFPPALRDRIGADVVALSMRRTREAAVRGRLVGAATAAACLTDILLRGLRARAATLHPTPFMGTLIQDLRHAVRSLSRAPRFTVAAVGILALGIGANSAIFSVVHAVMLQPLPFPEPERFVHIGHDYGGGVTQTMPYYRVDWLREQTRAFEALASWRGHGGRIERDGRFEGVDGLSVDADFLTTLGYPLALGRWFTDEESAPDGPPVVVLSDATWRARFGAAPDVLGQGFEISDRTYTVVGVLSPDFAFPQVSGTLDYLVPLTLRADPTDEGQNYPIVARLATGVTRAAAADDLARAWQGFREAHPSLVGDPERGPALTTFEELHVGNLRTVLWMIMGTVAVVLLIACANVANLLLARAAQRQHDIAVRAALGATRGRLAGHVLTESVLLAVVAGALGVGLARVAVEVLLGIAPIDLPRAESAGLNGPVLLFTLAAALTTGVVFGLAAAVPALRGAVGGTLRDGSRGSAAGRRVRQGLILVQAALAVVLLVGAGLLVETVASLRNVDAGFDADGVVAVSLPVIPPGYGQPGPIAALVDRVEEELRGDPAVSGLAAASNLPLERGLNLPLAIAGRPDAYEGAVEWRAVSDDYFDLLGIDLRSGRVFADTDAAGTPPVVIVSHSFADHYFPDQQTLGQRVEIGRWRGNYLHPSLQLPAGEIVGVVADVRDRSLKEEPRRTIYVPFPQVPAVLTTFPVLMARGPSAQATAGAVRSALQDADPRMPVPEVRPLDDVVASSIALERFNASLLGAFAALALLLTAFGVYGVISYAVSQRRREIGIRVALGAGRGQVVRMIVAQGMVPVVAGLAAGGLASLWLSRLVSGLIWGVEPNDPKALLVGGVVLLTAAVLASWLPAREATRLDPVRTLTAD